MENPLFSITNLGTAIRGLFQGTDRFTRGLNIGGDHFTDYVNNYNVPQEVYETISNNEMRLFKTTPEAFIPISRKATLFSNGRFVVKDYKTDKAIPNHPLIKALESPSPLLTRNEWLKAICINFHVFGNVYIYKNQPNPLTNPFNVRLPILPNNDIKIKTTGKNYKQWDKSDIIQHYELISNHDIILTDDMIHIKSYSEDGIKGMSYLEPNQMPISNARAGHGFNNVNLSKKGALGLITPTGSDAIGVKNMTEETQNALEKQFTETHGIFDGQTPVKFSKQPVDYKNLNYPIKDQMILETNEDTMRKLVDSIDLNMNIFSSSKGTTFNNGDAFLRSAYVDAIIPFSELICFAIGSSLNLFEQGIYIELDYSHIPALQENQKDVATNAKVKSEALQGLVSIGYTIQEAEQLLGITQE